MNKPGPEGPTDLSKRSWWGVLKRTVKEFQEDNLTDWAAALTYYGVLALFPALLVLVSVIGLFGDETVNQVMADLTVAMPEGVRTVVQDGVKNLQENGGRAGAFAIFGLVTALWSASGYISAFIRAANAIYDVPEGRPVWKTLPLRVGLTMLTGTLMAVGLLLIVFTGRLAESVGRAIGVGETFVTVWDIAKWPVLIVIVMLVLAILYWLSPNAEHTGFRWITPGGILAVLLWLIASAGFAIYVKYFAKYQETYGALAGAILFLVWLWISNIAILLGAEFDAELERGRAIEGGHPPEHEPFLPLRDDRKVKEEVGDRGLA
jgi:membrane protein